MKEQCPVEDNSKDDLVDVSIIAGMSVDDSRVSASGKTLTWDKGDAIGIFYGSANNVKFTLTSGEGSGTATFSGQLPTGTNQQMYAYYPYDETLTNKSALYATLKGQIYDGDYTETGVSSNYRKHAFMVSSPGYVTVSKAAPWPSGKTLEFKHKTSLVLFDLTSTLDQVFSVDNISICANGTLLFKIPSYYTFSGSQGAESVDKIGVDITLEKGKELVLPASDASTHKYVQMVVMPSLFTSTGHNIDIVVSGFIGGRRVLVKIPKTVTNVNNFGTGKRIKISVPITSSSTMEYQSLIRISQNGTSLTAPIFYRDTDFKPDVIIWGDGTKQTYQEGVRHIYSVSGSHDASASFSGKVNIVNFDNLDNITAIDFSAF